MELLIKRSPKLELHVIDGPAMEKELLVKLNALGVESKPSVRMAYLAQNKLLPSVSSGHSEDP
jgi:hypothetical protein